MRLQRSSSWRSESPRSTPELEFHVASRPLGTIPGIGSRRGEGMDGPPPMCADQGRERARITGDRGQSGPSPRIRPIRAPHKLVRQTVSVLAVPETGYASSEVQDGL
jgi:hypothetical protein